jgi:hypothetical protein
LHRFANKRLHRFKEPTDKINEWGQNTLLIKPLKIVNWGQNALLDGAALARCAGGCGHVLDADVADGLAARHLHRCAHR